MNYQREMEAQISQIPAGTVPRLLLHSCCGPCSSAVLERLSPHFAVTVYFYNPNIEPEEEYLRRLETQKQIIQSLQVPNPVSLLEGTYEPGLFEAAVQGLENEPEGGRRCSRCFLMRLESTARAARDGGYDFFTTTLSVSPHKDAEKLDKLGLSLEKEFGIRYLRADFKKKNGYLRSIELSREYGLYRQDYCGCQYSMWREKEEN